MNESANLVETSSKTYPVGMISGTGASLKALNAMASEVARTSLSVLIEGESGSGKDTYAHFIHSVSAMSEGAFRKINCAALDPDRIAFQASEAMRDFASHSRCGTLYLDNVQELDLAGQRALFSQLSDGESGGEPSPRFISSTTRSLVRDVESGRFRRELYFRLNGACLSLPPLRERTEDVASLLEYFLVKHCGSPQTKIAPFGKKALDILVNYRWPGNIRELENFALKVIAFGDAQNLIRELEMSWKPPAAVADHGSSPSLKSVARAASWHAEREMIVHALERTRWNRKRAAQELRISYKSLLYKIKQMGAFQGDQEN